MDDNLNKIEDAVLFQTASGYLVVMNEDDYIEFLKSVNDSF